MFEKNLKRIRTDRGYTQRDVAEFLKISPQSISKWENGEATPSVEFLPKLAQMLECSIDDFFKEAEISSSKKIDIESFIAFLKSLEKKKGEEGYISPCSFMSENDGWQDNLKIVCDALVKEKFISPKAIQGIVSCDSEELKTVISTLECNGFLTKVPDSKLYAVNTDAFSTTLIMIRMSKLFAELGRGKSVKEALDALD